MIKDWSFILDRAIPFPHSRFWLIDVIGFPCNSVVSTSFQMIPFPIDRLLETSGRSRPIEPSYPTTTSFPFKSPFHLYSFFYSKTLRSWNAWSWKDEEYEKKKEESVDRKVNFFLFLLLFMDPKDKTYVRWQRLFKIAPHVPVAPSDNSRRQPINSTTLKQSWQLNDPGLEISILSFYSLTILSKIQRQKTQPSYPTQEVNTKRVFLMMDMIFLFSANQSDTIRIMLMRFARSRHECQSQMVTHVEKQNTSATLVSHLSTADEIWIPMPFRVTGFVFF